MLFSYSGLSLVIQDGTVQGIKLELFIFDPFPLAEPQNVSVVLISTLKIPC
jgi:hypothetical protein